MAGEHVVITMAIDEPKRLMDALRAEHPDSTIIWHHTPWTDMHAPAEVYKDATIIYTFVALPARVEDAPHLKWVHFLGAGINKAVDNPLYKTTSIPFSTNSGVAAPQIAEWVLLGEAAFRHGFTYLEKRARTGNWMPFTESTPALSVRSSVGARVGIFGYGAIGRQVGRFVSAQGAHVLAYTASPRPTQESRADDSPTVPGMGDPKGELPIEWFSGTQKADVHRFLAADLDWLVLCAPLTPATTKLLGAPEFALLGKKRAFLTNVARGEFIDDDALLAALKPGADGKESLLCGAHLDVTAPEPLNKESPLWMQENCLVTPHVAALSSDYDVRAFEVFGQNLRRFRKGEKLMNIVNRKTGY